MKKVLITGIGMLCANGNGKDAAWANLKVLASVRKCAGVKILLAQKAFSAFDTYPLIAKYLDGTTASGLYEARLAHEEMPTRENHVFNPAFTDEEFAEVAKICDHIVLNSVAQVRRFASQHLNISTSQLTSSPSRRGRSASSK